MHKTWFLLARQTRLDNTKFLLTKKIKDKVSSNKRQKCLRQVLKKIMQIYN